MNATVDRQGRRRGGRSCVGCGTRGYGDVCPRCDTVIHRTRSGLKLVVHRDEKGLHALWLVTSVALCCFLLAEAAPLGLALSPAVIIVTLVRWWIGPVQRVTLEATPDRPWRLFVDEYEPLQPDTALLPGGSLSGLLLRRRHWQQTLTTVASRLCALAEELPPSPAPTLRQRRWLESVGVPCEPQMSTFSVRLIESFAPAAWERVNRGEDPLIMVAAAPDFVPVAA